MGSGYRNFALGEVLTSANVNNYLMKQAVMCFNNAAARDAAITSPEEGMHAYLRDVDYDTIYTGSSWQPADPAPPTAILRHSAQQLIARETDTALLFNTEDMDSHNGHSTSSNTSRYTAPRSGVYQVSGAVTWSAASIRAKLEAFFRINGSGSDLAGSTVFRSEHHTGVSVLELSALARLSAGDFVEIFVWHNAATVSGGVESALAELGTAQNYKGGCRFEIEWRRSL